jgi:hypothetical protein
MITDQDMSLRNLLTNCLFNLSSKFKKHKKIKNDHPSPNFYGNLPNVGITSESIIDPNFVWEHDMNTPTVNPILYVHLLWFSTDSHSDRVILYDLYSALCMVFSPPSITTWSSANINVFVKFLLPNRSGIFRIINYDLNDSTHGLVKFIWSWKPFLMSCDQMPIIWSIFQENCNL